MKRATPKPTVESARDYLRWQAGIATTKARSDEVSLPPLKCMYGESRVHYAEGRLYVDGRVVHVRKTMGVF